ncbi:MAG: AAA family ATPase [Lachnospiraceae bacterium]|nr:AAA family ATPase [Lachnospiraceae bacterium]
MKLTSAKIRNFRGIEEWNITFKPGFNLIKGVNGRGKTSVLEAIAVGLGGFVAGLEGVATRHFSKDEIRQVYTTVGDGSYNKKIIVPTEVYLEADVDGESYEWLRGRKDIKTSRSTIQPRDICQKAELMANEENKELPILAYLGAGRVWSQRREKVENIFRKQYFRTVGYTDALHDASNIKLLLNWCVKMEQVAWQKEKKIAEYEAVKKAVSDFMQYMEPGADCRVFYDKQQEELMYERGNGILPVMSLSAGYQSLVWMVFDIAYRMAVLNPFMKESIAMTSGIVLIDEIDMHLHPKWQWNIINALQKVFPNVQFIAATHSPILFASAKDVWLIDVDGEEIEYSHSHYGIDINTSLNTYQETIEMPAEVKEKADAFNDAMDAERYGEALEILRELENNTAPTHPLLIQLRTRYDFETALGEI